MKYYHQGCCSWGWYYPYSHAPLASDLYDFLKKSSWKPTFKKGEPFPPFYQLLAVLPPQSKHALPAPLRAIMSGDQGAPLAEFFPRTWKLDFTHKFWKWQVCWARGRRVVRRPVARRIVRGSLFRTLFHCSRL